MELEEDAQKTDTAQNLEPEDDAEKQKNRKEGEV